MKALKVMISGSYKTAQNDIIDFEDVEGFVPFVDEAHAFMHIKSRFAVDWVKRCLKKDGEKAYPDRIEKVRQVFIDEIEEADHDFSYVGKGIKKMTYDELQDLATAKDLRYIPLPKAVSGFSLREARVRAYIAYSKEVDGKVMSENDEGFNFADLPDIIVDAHVRKDVSKKVTNEEIINNVADTNMPLTAEQKEEKVEELRKVLDEKKIKYHWNAGYDKLHSLLYGGGTA